MLRRPLLLVHPTNHLVHAPIQRAPLLGHGPHIGITKQQANLFQGLALGLGEEEVGQDAIGSVGSDKEEEIAIGEVLQADGCDLANDDVVYLFISGLSLVKPSRVDREEEMQWGRRSRRTQLAAVDAAHPYERMCMGKISLW